MAVHGAAALAIWQDCEPGRDAEMNEWHAREHFLERLAVPGFIRGRRYTGEGHPAYFTLYEAESPDVFTSAPYLERLNNPTELTRRVMPGFRFNSRTVCTVSAAEGRLDGGWVVTVDLHPEPGREAELRAGLEELLKKLTARPPIVAAALLEPDLERTRVPTEEKRHRAAEDRVAGWTLVLEAYDAAAPGDLPEQLRARGAAPEIEIASFRLAFELSAAAP